MIADAMVETDYIEFEFADRHYVARIATYGGGGGWGRVDVFAGRRIVGCGEFSRRGLVYLTMPVKPMRPQIEQLIGRVEAWA
ncbi:MAG TPA: hypothetical protein VEL07_19725 [Planctomycetota bacterium]|nr:hypothetical protein [Planctomycetota bacterium]